MNRRNHDYIMKYNARRYYPMVDDKLLTKTLAAKAGVPILTLRREALKVLGAARRFDTVRALADEAARLVSTGKGGASCPSSGAISDAIAGTA